MNKNLKKVISCVTAASMVFSMGATMVFAEEKTDIVLMIENADEPASLQTIEKIKEHFPQYNIVSKIWNTDAEKSIKSTFATNSEAVDLAMWNQTMSTFVNSDMAMDLTPYLEAEPEFAATFNDGILESAQTYFDEKTYGLCYSCVYPMVEVNTKILEEAGVEFKDAWTWDEFIDACEKIKENTDAYPIGCANYWAGWFGIQAFIQAFDNEEEYIEFCHGGIPFSDERILENMDKTVDLYKNYVYPGEGALTITGEEVDTAFANGKLAMRCDVNSVSKGFIDNLDIADQIKIMSWPTMAKEGVGSAADRLLGGNNLYFIPSNSKNPDAAWEIMKFLFSEEIQKDYAQAGTIICTNIDTGVDLSEWSKDSEKIAAELIYSNSAEISTYINTDFFSEYFYDKDTAVETMDEMIKNMAE